MSLKKTIVKVSLQEDSTRDIKSAYHVLVLISRSPQICVLLPPHKKTRGCLRACAVIVIPGGYAFDVEVGETQLDSFARQSDDVEDAS